MQRGRGPLELRGHPQHERDVHLGRDVRLCRGDPEQPLRLYDEVRHGRHGHQHGLRQDVQRLRQQRRLHHVHGLRREGLSPGREALGQGEHGHAQGHGHQLHLRRWPRLCARHDPPPQRRRRHVRCPPRRAVLRDGRRHGRARALLPAREERAGARGDWHAGLARNQEPRRECELPVADGADGPDDNDGPDGPQLWPRPRPRPRPQR
mmetsp:Transcript_9442/g.20690  ORF Transcript_9442/g.20690 Transcript_9442/m.20690 type:complete len:207 (-) Transcript_9442:781-1401(-)